MKENVVKEKSFSFALRIVELYRFLTDEQREFVLSRQLLRSGTAIGALVREAEQAESRADFIHKMAIALKEANESPYWIDLLNQSGYIDKNGYESIYPEIIELLKMLTAIIKSSKDNT
jgi:four helix bundle protein